MTTLTERYVREVVRRVPADQREDVADELRTTIADTIDGKGADDPAAAEREVLTEMGDPIRLAARYADRPLALIGPELYPAYIRLVTLLLTTVLPIVTAVMVVIDVFDNNDVGSAFATGIVTILTVGGQLVAWPTLAYALVERYRPAGSAVRATQVWKPEDLPEIQRYDKRGLEACAGAVFSALMIAAIVWQHVATPYKDMPVLDPALWSGGWIWPILAGLAGALAVDLVRMVVRGRELALAVAYALAEALFALPLAWILYRHEFFSPEFLADVSVLDEFYTVAVFGVLAVSAWEVFKRFREIWRP